MVIFIRSLRAKPLILRDYSLLRGAQRAQDHCLALTYTRVLPPDVTHRFAVHARMHIARA